jgi:hypothetical protein
MPFFLGNVDDAEAKPISSLKSQLIKFLSVLKRRRERLSASS